MDRRELCLPLPGSSDRLTVQKRTARGIRWNGWVSMEKGGQGKRSLLISSGEVDAVRR